MGLSGAPLVQYVLAASAAAQCRGLRQKARHASASRSQLQHLPEVLPLLRAEVAILPHQLVQHSPHLVLHASNYTSSAEQAIYLLLRFTCMTHHGARVLLHPMPDWATQPSSSSAGASRQSARCPRRCKLDHAETNLP